MARLRIRIELSRAGVGVPLGKLASVVDEAQKFLHMLAGDVHVDTSRGEWLGFDFDPGSLNFTAEFSGAASQEQVLAFYAAFDGTTSLRRTTIGQFAKIADAISEEELIGFGLFGADNVAEPSEWRCLSKRDARRIAEEIKTLLKATGEREESHLPAVTDAGARLFGRVRDDEASLQERLTRVERRVEQHSAQIQDLRIQSRAAEDSFRNLLSAVESFCDQATHQIERVTPAALPAAEAPRPGRRWMLIAAAAVLGIAALFAGIRMWPVRSAPVEITKVAAAPPPPPPTQTPQPEPQHNMMKIQLEASEPCWVALSDADGNRLLARALMPGDPRTIEVDHGAKLRTGNAGGLKIALNGKPLGVIGPYGKIREIEFKDGKFKITSPENVKPDF
jgi:hypothetical protein